MAGFDVEFGTDIMDAFLKTDVEALCEEMINESAPIMVESMRREVEAVAGDYSTGEAAKSISARKAKKVKNGGWISFVGPSGYSNHTFRAGKNKKRTYKVSNALKLIWKNYGIPGIQAARPFLERATQKAEKDVLKSMQEIYNKRTGGNGI